MADAQSDPGAPSQHLKDRVHDSTVVSTPESRPAVPPNIAPRVRVKGPNGACTHLTMTRLYTTEFRCCLCLRQGSFGWIYRCIQDRELLIEEDMEQNNEEKLDKLCDIFERSTTPLKRSPAARVSPLSFFDEITDKQLETYTPQQLKQILDQRALVLERASQTSDMNSMHAAFPQIANFLLPRPAISSNSPPKPSKTPWLPLNGGECQFKCCHTCRPTLNDRSYLSLNGIADDDIPKAATTGFGFHLQNKRPVALVKDVQNLGLRRNPPPRSSLDQKTQQSRPLIPATNRRDPTGLGIFTNQQENQRSSQSSVQATLPAPLSTMTTTFQSSGPVGPNWLAQFKRDLDALGLQLPRGLIFEDSDDELPSQSSGHEEAHLVPLPEQSAEELAMISGPLTPMEESEFEKGIFGQGPLEVNGGLAVMEESLEMRVADVVTQY